MAKRSDGIYMVKQRRTIRQPSNRQFVRQFAGRQPDSSVVRIAQVESRAGELHPMASKVLL